MTSAPVERALTYVARAEAPLVRRSRDAAASSSVVDLSFDSAKNGAVVVGSQIVSFVSGVTAERREAIVNSSLLAQLVATKKIADPSHIYDWYNAYFDVLTNIGWVVQGRDFAEYHDIMRTL